MAGPPTGQVFNNGGANDFKVGGIGGIRANFIFATENGTIAARPAGANSATTVATTAGAVYKGLAIGNNGAGTFLYAANFNSGKIDVFNSSFASTSLAGSFTDPALPAGYAPFNVQNLNGRLYVTYACRTRQNRTTWPGQATALSACLTSTEISSRALHRAEP